MTQEVNLLESTKTIVQLKGSCTEKMPELNYWKLYIQMEYLKDLMDFASESHGLTIKQIVKLGIDICTALEACHAKNIIHRDIKPANIMVSPDGYFKLEGIIELVYIVLQSVVKPGITGFFKIDLHIKCYIYLS